MRLPKITKMMSWRGEQMMAGTNALLRRMLEADIVPARRFHARDIPDNTRLSTDNLSDSHGRIPAPSARPSPRRDPSPIQDDCYAPQILLDVAPSAEPQEVFAPGKRWPQFQKVGRWLDGGEGTA